MTLLAGFDWQAAALPTTSRTQDPSPEISPYLFKNTLKIPQTTGKMLRKKNVAVGIKHSLIKKAQFLMYNLQIRL